MSLNKIGTLMKGRVNTVCVCTDDETGKWFTLWEVQRHKAARMLMDMQGESPFAVCHMEGESLWVLLAYEEPRPLDRFYQGSLYSWEERRRIYENVIEACVNADVPYPLLYLLLGGRCINIRQDGSMYFTYCVMLDHLNAGRTEKDCVRLAAELLADLMELHGKKEEKSCLALMRKKLRRNAYNSFTELSHDIKFIDGRKRLSLIWGRIPYPEQSTKDKLFRILLVLTVVLVITAAVLIVSQLVFGDLPFLRAFNSTMRKIGTESLVK